MSLEAESRSQAPEHGTGVTLEELDRDGAIVDSIAGLYGEPRAQFLRKAIFGGAVLLGALATPPLAAAGTARSDTTILNFDLVFEYLQSSFYLSAVREGTVARMPLPKERWARVLGAHELAHVRILKKVLGEKAVKKPFFNFRGVTESAEAFIKTAVAMEDLTVALLAGQAPRLRDRSLVAAVFSLLTVEARHAAWARRISGFVPVGSSLDQPKPISEVRRIVASTRFLAARPVARGHGRPRFTG